MSGDILQTPDAPKPQGALDNYFKITARGSTVRQEVLAGLTTFLAMVYSVIVVPGMLGKAGFPPAAVFVATCLVAGFGSLLMGLWANLPMAIGCAISLTAFTAFSLVLGQQISVPVALGAVFLMGVIFTAISVTGVRTWILRNLPMGIAHGTGIGIGLFLLLIAANGVGMVIKNPIEGLPVALGAFTSFPVMMSLLGLAVIFGLEKCRVPGGILLVIIAISIIGLIFDPAVKYHGLVAMPSLTGEDGKSLIFSLDIMGALQPTVLPSVLALVMTAVFDATGTIRAVAGQANLLDKDNQIINGGKALTSDSVSSIFSGLVGAAPAAVYIESAAGTAAGGKTGLTATVVGALFLLILFLSPLSFLIPGYATAPALMYVGLIRTAMGEPGPDGRRRPRPVAGSEFELPADVLIMAFGFQAHAMPWLQGSGIKLDKWGLIQTGDVGYLPTQTHLKKVFAGGDAVHGADLVVTAMAAGRQAARDMLTLFDTKAS